MRGKAEQQPEFISIVNLEERVPRSHPIRRVKEMCGKVFRRLDRDFKGMYAAAGRPSVPPETLLGAQVLIALYSVRGNRQFCERLEYDLLFRWFLDMSIDQPAFNASTFSKNMDRLMESKVAELFFAEVVELAREGGWAGDEHFSADGTLIESWASMKSFRPKKEEESSKDDGEGQGGTGQNDNNGWADFQGQKRSNNTHQSRTDPESRLLRKGKGREAKLCFGAHAVMENRNGLCVALKITSATGVTEPTVAAHQLEELKAQGFTPKTVGADKNYHTKAFVQTCRERGTAPHLERIKGRKTPGLDGRNARGKGYRKSLVIRKRIEEIFGWMKTTGGFRRTRYRGIARTNLSALITGASYNLVRLSRLQLLQTEPL